MEKPMRKRLRWDRIGMVAGVLALATFGIAAIVPHTGDFDDTRSEGRTSAVLPEDAVIDIEPAPAVQMVPKTVGQGSLRASDKVDAPEVRPVETGPLPRKGIAPCSCSKRTMKLARNPYTDHQKRARSLPGSFFVKNDAEMQAGFQRGDLQRVPEVGRGYHLDKLTHSHPFLLPSAMAVLEEMSSRFADAMEGTSDEGASIRITSLTRTQSQQSRLRRRNANAFNGRSTHNYGASFDVAFIDRPSLDVGCGGPSWALQAILQDMQKQGRILVIPEGNCMHITPRQS